MNIFLRSPIFYAFILFIALIALGFLFSIRMYDALLVFEKSEVHFELTQKVSLKHLLGFSLNELVANGIQPKLSLIGKGIMMLLIIHIGLPLLIYIRFKATNDRKKLNQ